MSLAGITISDQRVGDLSNDGTIDFGSLVKGSTASSDQFTLTNHSGQTVSVFSPPGFTLQPSNVTADDGQTVNFTLTPNTAQTGTFTGGLFVSPNFPDPSNPSGETDVHVKLTITPANVTVPNRNLGTITTGTSDAGQASIQTGLDSSGNDESIPSNRVLLFSLPAGTSNLTITASPAVTDTSGNTCDLGMELVKDTNGDGNLNLSELNSPVKMWTALNGQANQTFHQQNLAGGKYFLVLSAVNPIVQGQSDVGITDNLNLSAVTLTPAHAVVTFNGTGIANGESSPTSATGTDFGSVNVGAASPMRTFTVMNTGQSALTISNLTAPAGYDINPGLPQSIAGGSSATFTLDLLTGTGGTFTGNVSFGTSDPNAATFQFKITGTINTVAPPFAILSGGILTITGTGGADTISANSASGTVTATLNGNSKTFSESAVTGIDILAGSGNDSVTVTGDAIPATLLGGLGDDTLNGGAAADSIGGGMGNDVVAGGGGNDTLRAGQGNDSLRGGMGNDIVFGGQGNDTLRGGQGDDMFFARDGLMDQIFGGLGNNSAQTDAVDQVTGIQIFIP